MEIKLYTQVGCPQCKMVHMLLDKNKIKYTEIQDLDEMRSLGFNHTPVLVVDGKVYTGKVIHDWIREHGGR